MAPSKRVPKVSVVVSFAVSKWTKALLFDLKCLGKSLNIVKRVPHKVVLNVYDSTLN